MYNFQDAAIGDWISLVVVPRQMGSMIESPRFCMQRPVGGGSLVIETERGESAAVGAFGWVSLGCRWNQDLKRPQASARQLHSLYP
jgi:hypothetical protein